MKRKKTTRKSPKKKIIKPLAIKFSKWHMGIIAITAFFLYANTFTHGYTQDDAIVITDNMYTQEGLSGIPGLLTKDTFFGFFKVEGKEKLVAGGRYRPLTLVMFAFEQEVFGNNATIRHIINTLLYALLCVVLYQFIILAFKDIIRSDKLPLFALIAALTFTFHPIHTEAVANIKGRDEIMAFLLGCLSMIILFKDHKNKFKKYLGAGSLFFLAMMSKENAITLIPVAFLIFFLFRNKSIKESTIKVSPLIAGTLIFLVIRFSILGFDTGDAPLEMMNNPFVKYENGGYSFFTLSEKIASIIFVLGWYIKLLVLPYPLTNDYYPRQVEVMGLDHPLVLISLIGIIILTITAFWFWKKNKLISFSIFYFILTISIFSNILFPIGTHLSERFLFMPSLGYCLLLAYVLWNIYYKFGSYVFGGLCIILAGLYGFQSVTRNMDWKDDYTLYTTDVKVSVNSAKALNAAGGVLVTNSVNEQDPNKKSGMLNDAIGYLNKATGIHPNYKNAWLLLGNAKFYQKEYEGAIAALDRSLSIDPGYKDAFGNLGVVLREAGRNAGNVLGDLSKAKSYLLRSYQINSTDTETNRLLGISESIAGNHAGAVPYYTRLTTLAPQNALGYKLLSQAYTQLGDSQNAQINRTKALQIDPNAFNK